jgi:AcrR family transcriptional regulator
MSDRPSKREQLREERRGQILKAALDVFARKGYHAANVSDVAAEAGVSQGTIYWYFKSKEDLLVAALLSFFDDFGQETGAMLGQCATARDRLQALSRSMVDLVFSAKGLFTLFLEYWGSSPNRQAAGQVWSDVLVQYKELLVGIIQEGIQNGEFRPVDADGLAWALMAAYDGLAAYVLLVPDLDPARVSQSFMGTILDGLQDPQHLAKTGQSKES